MHARNIHKTKSKLKWHRYNHKYEHRYETVLQKITNDFHILKEKKIDESYIIR